MDSVARAAMQGITQFNGRFGCNWCLHPGKYVSNPFKSRAGNHKYLLLDFPVEMRNVNDTISHMMAAMPKKPCFGVKNPSTLINLKHFSIIEGFVAEPLHILSGMGKQFAIRWFGTYSFLGR